MCYSIVVDVETYGLLSMKVLAHIGEDITIKLEIYGKCLFLAIISVAKLSPVFMDYPPVKLL